MCIFMFPIKLTKKFLILGQHFLRLTVQCAWRPHGRLEGGGGEETLTLENLENAGIPNVLTILCREEL